jgi:hypothetical protein
VDSQTRLKIVSGEFVNLSNLLVRNSDHQAQIASILSVDKKGQIISQPKQAKQITTIERWTDAFILFIAIYSAAHPEKYLQILKYMHDVRLGAEKSQGWLNYYEQFRLRMVTNPYMDWDKVDTGTKSMTHLYDAFKPTLTTNGQSVAKMF